ncbi:MAG: 3'(2'),5'-bisphosphate nucleotidase CysQ [Halobacteriovoraceae bacterium]|nr:3'(2'),5'-bisphosphate nucleotidase CysQ [Halobacteriovoraceae bacterium]
MIGEASVFFDLGDHLLKSYGKVGVKKIKEDLSPFTEMDLFSHRFLVSYLKKILDLPVLSEEKTTTYKIRKSWDRFWMIDPLDGTKAYIKGVGDFTVNICLIEKNRPIEALILSPTRQEIYYAKKGGGSHLISRNQSVLRLPKTFKRKLSIFHSHTHEGESLKKLLSKSHSHYSIPLSSAIKFCLVAKNDPSSYLRLAGSSEWDVAAGDLIVREAGGIVFSIRSNIKKKLPLIYNKSNLRNPPFIALSRSCSLKAIGLI